MDLIIRRAALVDSRGLVDIGMEAGRIAAIEPHLAATAREEIDANGSLVTAPFVDAHFHMDATLSYGLPRVNASGTLLEGIALWGELKPDLTQEALVERALQYCDWAVARGLLAIRSHVDVCDPRLLAVEALVEVKRRVKPYLDLQLVAFPQDGVLRSAGAFENLKRAIAMGVDVVGGIPHFERTMADGAAVRDAAVRVRGGAGLARGHALRRIRRSDVAPHRNARGRNASARPARARDRLASDVDAFDGQLLRQQAHAADARGGRRGDRESAHQHHAARALGHVSEAARHDARAGTDGGAASTSRSATIA